MSPSNIEAHASEVYTRTIFFEVQKELKKAVWFCGWEGFYQDNDNKIYTISHKSRGSLVKANYTVVQNMNELTVVCSCNHFVRNGILCRHALKVLLNDETECIPDKYIMRRWRRELVPVELLPARARYGEVDVEKERLMNNAYSLVDRIIGRVRNDRPTLALFVENLEQWDANAVIDGPHKSSSQRKSESIQEFLGVSQPETVDIFPPTGIRNKGCGTGKRLVGVAERAISKGKKMKRMCRSCGQLAKHDSRNCPNRGVGQ